MSAIIKLEIFSLISILCVVLALFLTHRFVKKERRKIIYLVSAVICVGLHYSKYVYDIFNGATYPIPGNLLVPQWPCNIMMWLVLVSGILMFFGDSFVLKYYLYITSWVGAICALAGICVNFNFLNTPDFFNYDILKGLLSHVFLLYCTLYPFIEGKVRYNFFRITLTLLIAGVVFILCANFSTISLRIIGRSDGEVYGNMLASPFDSMPWLNLYVMEPLIAIIWVIGATIFELIAYPKGKRWFNRLKFIKNELKED